MLNLSTLNSFSNLYVWKKNCNLQFVDLNQSCAHVFGFKNIEEAIGKNDYDIPSDLAKFAEIFRANDKQVMKSGKQITFLEIQPCANNEWKILHVVKQPYYEKKKLKGVLGYSIDITKAYLKIEQFMAGNHVNLFIQSEEKNLNHSHIPKLTSRESECLFFLLRRYTAKEIANFLQISFRTVEHHIEILRSKFHCKSKVDLFFVTKELGFLNVIPQTILGKQLSIIVE